MKNIGNTKRVYIIINDSNINKNTVCEPRKRKAAKKAIDIYGNK